MLFIYHMFIFYTDACIVLSNTVLIILFKILNKHIFNEVNYLVDKVSIKTL